LRVLPAGEMTPARLALEMASLAAFTPAAHTLNLRGAERTADLLAAMLEHDASAPMPLERTA